MVIALYDDWSTGDIVQSLFFSPAESGLCRIIGGIEPAMLLPSASEKILGAGSMGDSDQSRLYLNK
ncbi:hypothetical protein [Acinetobacter sp. ANC 4173]|uniref:hypothetical protein n=1 Tax=Acinetobacter sp. ANC 4173 TaxID=2529837 RepID=UPI001D0D950A|nr:hypothetical protein [Acinetobacter sp. ANC 4173]